MDSPPSKPLTAAEHAAAKAEAAAWKAKFLAEFPALQVTERPVAADENGFLLLFQLGDHLRVSEEFAELLTNVSTCDPEVAKRGLAEHAEHAEHADLVAQVERIGALTTRSSTGMPDDCIGFISARSGKRCVEILLLEARLAAGAGDENETLRLISTAGNLAEHFQSVEAPTFLGETVYVLMDLSIQGVAFTTLLPALGKTADLERWKSQFWKRTYSTTEFTHVLRGEWQTGADFMVFPVLAGGAKMGGWPDGEAVGHFYSSWVNEVVTKLPSLGLVDLESALTLPAGASKLSEEGRQILEDVCAGMDRWTFGYVRAAVVHAQAQAAMDLLILEKSGTRLVADDADRITRDPVSGQPFVFDPASRELLPPDDSASMEIEPLTLPW